MNSHPTPADIPRAGLPYLATALDATLDRLRGTVLEQVDQRTADVATPATEDDATDTAPPATSEHRPAADRLSRWQYSRHVALGHAIRSYSDVETRPSDTQLIETARAFERWIRTGER